MKKRIVSIILAVFMVAAMFSCFAVTASAAVTGDKNNNIAWTFDGKTLCIYYDGTIDPNYALRRKIPDRFCDNLSISKTAIQNVVIDSSITGIGAADFKGCTKLVRVTIPGSAMSIGDSAFYGCTSLTSVEIQEGVTSIGGSAFYGCTSLTSVEIQEGVTSIGIEAFFGCTALTSVTIPSSMTSIGIYAFNDLYALKVTFTGTKEEWEKIEINIGLNSCLETDKIVFHQHTPVPKTTTTYTCSECNAPLTEEQVKKTTESTGNGAGSVLSGGSLAIITAIVGVVIGMAVMYFVTKKKKPVTAEE